MELCNLKANHLQTKVLSSPLLHTELQIPRLYDPRLGANSKVTEDGNILQFNLTHVAQVSELYVLIRNPSGHPIKVRLTTHESEKGNPYSNSGRDTNTNLNIQGSTEKNYTDASKFLSKLFNFRMLFKSESSNEKRIDSNNASMLSQSVKIHVLGKETSVISSHSENQIEMKI